MVKTTITLTYDKTCLLSLEMNNLTRNEYNELKKYIINLYYCSEIREIDKEVNKHV
jgi:hypothetical protein